MENKLESINQVALSFLQSEQLEDVYCNIVDSALHLMKAQNGSILLEKNGRLERVYASSNDLYQVSIRKRGFTFNVYETLEPRIIGADELIKSHPSLIRLGIKSTVLIPLAHNKRAIGVITLQFKNKMRFSKKDLYLMSLIGSLATMAIEKTTHYDEIKKTLELRNMFVAIAAHELRTPLTTISGYIQLLQKKIPQATSTEGRYVQALAKETKKFIALIQDLVDVNRLGSGKLDFQYKEVHVTDILGAALTRLHSEYPGRNISYLNKTTNKSDIVIGDSERLVTLYYQLIENAAKYSAFTDKITITVKKDNQYIHFSVKDQGKGINKKDLPHIFSGFFKGSGNVKEGFGVGLMFAKYITEKHNGIIKIKSQINRGTQVDVMLPVAHT